MSTNNNFLSDKLTGYANNFIDILRNTSIETYIMGVLGLTLSFSPIVKKEKKRAAKYPIGFSEFSQRIKESKLEKNQISYSNLYPMFVNDLTMKNFESFNKSLDAMDEYDEFEWQIATHNEMSLWKWKTDDIFELLPKLADSAKKELSDFIAVRNELNKNITQFKTAWKEYSDDKYRTEIRTYTVTVSDGNGKSHVETRTELVQVYDHTNYDYTYNKSLGERGFQLLKKQFLEKPKLNVPIIKPATKTNPDNEEAIYESRKSRTKKTWSEYTKEDFLKASTTWFRASILANGIVHLNDTYKTLESLNKVWKEDKKIAPQFNGYHHEDDRYYSGPKPFQTCENINHAINRFIHESYKITDGIDLTTKKIKILQKEMKTYQNIVDGFIKPGDPKYEKPWKAKERVMELTETIYQANFENGIDLNRFRYWRVALLLLGITAVSAAAGKGIDYLTTKYNLYGKITPRNITGKVANRMQGYRRNYVDEHLKNMYKHEKRFY